MLIFIQLRKKNSLGRAGYIFGRIPDIRQISNVGYPDIEVAQKKFSEKCVLLPTF